MKLNYSHLNNFETIFSVLGHEEAKKRLKLRQN